MQPLREDRRPLASHIRYCWLSFNRCLAPHEGERVHRGLRAHSSEGPPIIPMNRLSLPPLFTPGAELAMVGGLLPVSGHAYLRWRTSADLIDIHGWRAKMERPVSPLN